MRAFRPLLTFAICAAPLAAQEIDAPTDWIARLDAPQAVAEGQDVAAGEWRYQRMPPGWHVTTTEAGVLLFPEAVTLSGRWGVEVELFLFPNPSNEGLGIVIEGVEEEGQLRFLMRRDGQASLEARFGDVVMIPEPWTADTLASVHDTNGVIKYVLRLMHQSGKLAFSINGHEMYSQETEGDAPEVIPGLRIGRGLDVHVSRFDLIAPLAPPAASQQ
jgi:hypothetical protein